MERQVVGVLRLHPRRVPFMLFGIGLVNALWTRISQKTQILKLLSVRIREISGIRVQNHGNSREA
jgi:hypothetical protein